MRLMPNFPLKDFNRPKEIFFLKETIFQLKNFYTCITLNTRLVLKWKQTSISFS